MDKLQVFQNVELGSVRTTTINGEPFFIGKDVADILGYANSRKALIDHIDDEDKGVTKCDTLGGIQELTVINESGLYSLILSSKLPNAKKFKRWVTSEVLPSIRKTGTYSTKKVDKDKQLEIKEYGEWYHDKARYSNKEVDSFRYYDSIIPILKQILITQ